MEPQTETTLEIPGEIFRLPFIARGISGLVFEYAEGQVVKWPYGLDGDRDHQTERRIYNRLGHHERIVEVIALLPNKGIVMERLKEPLFLRLQSLQERGQRPSTEEIWRWASQMAEGLQYIHRKGVRQGDVSSANLLLDENDNVKFADFAGSSIDGEKAYACVGSRGQAPQPSDGSCPSIKEEIFAMGSVFYEIATTLKPYSHIETREVKRLYATGQFPETSNILLGSAIRKCWKMQFEDVSEVLTELKELYAANSSAQPR